MSQILRNGIIGSALALIVAAALPACSGSSEPTNTPSSSEKTGAIGLELTTPGGVVVNTVNYTVSGNGITAITGTIDTSGPGATASAFIGALPSSQTGATGDYTVTMSATGADGVTQCQGASAPFRVTAGTTISVTIPLTCGAPTVRGNAKLNGEFNSCPVIESMIVAPLETNLNGVIAVSALATDTDVANTLTYAWTATAGTFTDATLKATSYKCSVPGIQTLTMTVSDGSGCLTMLQTDVNCTTAEVCGNNSVGPGEQCDPPNGTTCSANCQTITVVCGNSIVQPGETCDPPNGTTCDTACHNIVCGDGTTAGAEQCDPPLANFCDASCQKIAPVCGNGVVQAPETCDDSNTVSGDGCSSVCKTEVVDPCPACTTTSCSAAKAACDATNPACQTILDCIKTSNCADGSARDGAECYCGSLDNDTCFNSFNPAVPQGVCKAAIEAAAGSNIPLSIGQIFFDLSTSVGSAFQTTSCQLSNCKTQCEL